MARQSRGDPRRSSDPLTLMLFTGRSGSVRKFTLKRPWLRFLGVVGGIGLVAVPLLLADYIRVRSTLGQLDRLRQENSSQREELDDYVAHLQRISEQLAEVGRLDRKLRIITNLDPADPLPLPGIGGLEGEEFEPLQVAALSRRRRHQRLLERLGGLQEAAGIQGQRLEELIAHLEDKTARLAATPSITPTRGWITSDFGYRTSPFTGSRELHRGIDIAARTGTPIISPADGRVRYTGDHRALGRSLIVRHGYGIETLYGHLSELRVKSGDRVKRGDTIALMGNSGRSTGPHLHFQVQVNGVPVNPRNYMLD